MFNYSDALRHNLGHVPSIARDSSSIVALNNRLSNLAAAGLTNLVSNVVAPRKPDKDSGTFDMLLEAWVASRLLRNPHVRDLAYEPKDMADPPDFRFRMGTIRFAMQVKRLYGGGNAADKALFRRRLDERAPGIPQPWFIDFWLDDEFNTSQVDGLFYFIKKNMTNFEPDPEDSGPSYRYRWPESGDLRARFSFRAASTKVALPHLHIGTIIVAGDFEEVPDEGPVLLPEKVKVQTVQNSLKKQMDKARHTVSLTPGPDQVNLVVIQPAHIPPADDNTFGAALYGEEEIEIEVRGREHTARVYRKRNGLFPRNFKTFCGVIIVPPDVDMLKPRPSARLNHPLVYYPHPLHLETIPQHPQPFDGDLIYYDRMVDVATPPGA